MCEHAGMLNHLYAKIDDLEIGEGAGGRADRTAVLRHLAVAAGLRPPGRRADAAGRAGGDPRRRAVRRHDRRRPRQRRSRSCRPTSRWCCPTSSSTPATLPDLRFVSVTGEALKKELTERWFAAHARRPAGQRLRADRDLRRHQPRGHGPAAGPRPGAAGPPVNNVRVLRRRRAPVAGAARRARRDRVLRGVRRPRVRQRPRADRGRPSRPTRYRPGERLYRSGDHGRWLPDGQAGVPRPPGHPGQDLRLPDRDRRGREHPAAGARASATVPWWSPRRSARTRYLVAFYTGAGPLETELLRDRLAASLPAYMVPTAFHWRESLPLTANGKIDRKALTALAGALRRGAGSRRPADTDRAAAGGRVGEGAGHPARTTSAGRTPSSTAAARRCRR